jgi:hypothetical protein
MLDRRVKGFEPNSMKLLHYAPIIEEIFHETDPNLIENNEGIFCIEGN